MHTTDRQENSLKKSNYLWLPVALFHLVALVVQMVPFGPVDLAPQPGRAALSCLGDPVGQETQFPQPAQDFLPDPSLLWLPVTLFHLDFRAAHLAH